MSTLAESLLAFQDNPSHHSEVFRILIRHSLWHVPAREGQPLLQQTEQKNHLHIYSSKDHLTEHNHPEIGSVEFTSTWLFGNLPLVDSIVIDGHTDHALQIPTSLFPSLIRMNRAQKIEGILAAQSNDDNFMVALKDFDAYYLPLVQDSNGQNHVALAPDHQQRALVAVFTAEDAAQRFMQAATEKLNNLQMDIVTGEKLFHHLDLLPLDGMVLNCYGPTIPVAINKSTISTLAAFNRP